MHVSLGHFSFVAHLISSHLHYLYELPVSQARLRAAIRCCFGLVFSLLPDRPPQRRTGRHAVGFFPGIYPFRERLLYLSHGWHKIHRETGEQIP